MPDITMCDNHDCPRIMSCYRYNAIPTPGHQAYFAESTLDKKGNCEYYIPIATKEKNTKS